MVDNSGDKSWVNCIFLQEINRQFISMGDQDYVAARQAYWNRMPYPFIWLAGQAIEKQLKASLLVRGQPIKIGGKKGHNLIWHLTKLRELPNFELPDLRLPTKILEDLFAGDFVLPRFSEWKHEDDSLTYVKNLNDMYQPSLRYGTESYEVTTFDLFRLDQFIFHLRNDFLCIIGLKSNYDINDLQFGEIMLERLGEDAVKCLKRANQIFYPSGNKVNLNGGIGLFIYNQDWRDTRSKYDQDWQIALKKLSKLTNGS